MNGFDQMNALGKEGTPFLFLINFEKTDVRVYPLTDIQNSDQIWFQFRNKSNHSKVGPSTEKVKFDSETLSYDSYLHKFNQVKKAIQMGNTYLLNLTYPSTVKCNLDLREIYHRSDALFKAHVKDEFVFFSPERFIEIKDNELSTFPMKGTIDATIPDAKEVILEDVKEKAEHNTIVDLLRNDISQVATHTRVEQYRFVDEISTHKGKLLQVSSKITAELDSGWNKRIGDILDKLTPAGSICGAPKQKTCELIQEIENYERGFYTGVCGVFTGSELLSGVMIRFIEQTKQGLVFKSGGGIHNLSKPEDEYNELIQKVYLPFS